MGEALKVGLIGAGSIAGAHVRVYREYRDQVRLAAVCDIDAQAAQRRAAEAGLDGSSRTVYTDAQAMLAQADIDAVDICTAHHLHAPLALAAIRAGKHVLLEKPLATTLADCRTLIDAAERAGVTLMVGQMQRYNPRYRAIHRLIQAGELGALRAVRLDAMQNMPDVMPHSAWLFDGAQAGGGVVMSVAIHKIDLARYLVGEVKQVSALRRTVREPFRNGAEDYAAALLEFENGAIGELFATYSGFRAPWGEMLTLFGDDGAVHLTHDYQGNEQVLYASRGQMPHLSDFHDTYTTLTPLPPDRSGLPSDDAFANEILHFAHCCRTGAEPLTSGRDNLKTVQVVLGIYAAARSGQPVALDQLAEVRSQPAGEQYDPSI